MFKNKNQAMIEENEVYSPYGDKTFCDYQKLIQAGMSLKEYKLRKNPSD